MKFSDIASVSGKGGLFKIISFTRTGVILESMDGKRKVASRNNKISVLSEISVYTASSGGDVPLEEVMKKIHKEFDGNTGLGKNSTHEEFRSFLRCVLSGYDEDRVYVSDIKKLVRWYMHLVKEAPEVLVEPNKEKEGVPKKDAKPKTKEEGSKDE